MRFREFLESYDKLGTGIKKGHTLEARGTKGEDKKEWAKSFKDKAELDKWVKDNDAKVFGIAYAEKVTESVGQTPWEIICDIVEKDHGEESLVDLAIAEAGRILNLGKADEIAGKEFFDLPVGKMKALVNAHPELLKGKAASRYKKQLTESEQADVKSQEEKPGAGGKIEAYGIQGMNSKKWRKVFKNEADLERWTANNDAEVQGRRSLNEAAEKTFTVTVIEADDQADDLDKSDLSKIIKVLKRFGEVSDAELTLTGKYADRGLTAKITVDYDTVEDVEKFTNDIYNTVTAAIPSGYTAKVR